MDTIVAVRRVFAADPVYPVVRAAVDSLLLQGELLDLTPQVLIEFQALATRPVEANGWGLTAAVASAEARTLEPLFPLLPETADIYPLWRNLVDAHDVRGGRCTTPAWLP